MSADTMAEEGFLRRWARLKSSPEPAQEAAVVEAPPPAAPAVAQVQGAAEREEVRKAERPLPTLDDVARLTPESDYSAFVAKGVDKAVQRMALKKLFADPNFAVMDGLDIYIADYNKSAPISGAMLASLKHAPSLLSRLLGDDDEKAGALRDARHDKDAPQDKDAPHDKDARHDKDITHDLIDPRADSGPGMPRQGTT